MTKILIALFAVQLATAFAFAQARGNDQGGGGDGTEMRVDEIRADLLDWIHGAGPESLIMPQGLPLQAYRTQLAKILAPQAVIVSTVTTLQESQTNSSDQQVIVAGQKKTCRGFVGNQDLKPHILCNSERFGATSPSDQYRLIHHEFAGLIGVEHNLGGASDYAISNQLTDFLRPATVLRLGVVRNRRLFPADRGFSFEGAALAFRGARAPSLDELAGKWVAIGRANFPADEADGHWPDGKFQLPGKPGYFSDTSTFSTPTTDVFGHVILNVTLLITGYESGTIYERAGPFPVYVDGTGAKFPVSGHGICAVKIECRIANGDRMLICAVNNDDCDNLPAGKLFRYASYVRASSL